jgi:hypothetical protein
VADSRSSVSFFLCTKIVHRNAACKLKASSHPRLLVALSRAEQTARTTARIRL